MPFVKLDTGILDSSLWIEPEQRIMFITALCMAMPYELTEPAEEIETEGMDRTGFIVPPGFYGLVRASSLGIIGRTWPHDKPDVPMDRLFSDLKELSLPDPFSRSDRFEGRRMVRINGGFIILNFSKYREMDRTAAERAKRYRDGQASRRDKRDVTLAQRDATGDDRDAVTHAEAEAEAPTTLPTHFVRKARMTLEELKAVCLAEQLPESDAEWLFDKWEGCGWRNNGKPMKDVRATIRSWKRAGYMASQKLQAGMERMSFKEAAQAREADLHKQIDPRRGF